MGSPINYVLRGLQAFWTLLILALTGNMISLALGGNPSIVNYCMFVAVFSTLSLFYLFGATFSEAFAGHPMGPMVVDTLNVLFFFCGAVALAAEMGAHNCGDDSYTSTNNVTSGSSDNHKRCQEGQAVCAFLWFGFASYVATLIMLVAGGSASGINMRGGAGGIRRNGPSMSQV